MKKAVVTGAGSGLGLEIAQALGDMFDVHRVDHAFEHDVTDPAGRNCWVKPVADIQDLDLLINCAGVNRISWLETLQDSTWDETMNTNAKGIYKMTKHYLAALERVRGTVLNIVSNASHMPMRGSIAYNASKGAAHIMTLQMARELYGRHGITVFGISPNKLAGTAMSKSIDEQVCEERGWTMEQARKYQLAGLAIGEETDPTVLARFIAYLLSSKENHRYLHGCIIPYGA